MAIEGNDWYYLGGAALGGALLGALGQHMFGSEPIAGRVLVVGRTYVKDKTKIQANVIADFTKGGYTTELESREAPYESRTFPRLFEEPEHAAEFLDKFMEKMGFEPDGNWATYLEMELEGDEESLQSRSIKS